MKIERLAWWGACLLLLLLFPAVLAAQTNCEEGSEPLNTSQPQGTTPQNIIQKFAAKEAIFKQARENYTYTRDVTVQTLNGSAVDGEFREVADILYDDKGNRVESVTFAPPSSLNRVSLSKQDYDDIRNGMPFVLTTEDLPQYNVLYAGTQHLDEIDAYVFDVAPKKMENGKRYFRGRVWVDNQDVQIVKTCGKSVPDAREKNRESLSPTSVTYREQIDGQYWFPTYSRGDDTLHFGSGDVHIREIVKYTKYRRLAPKSGRHPQQ
jgi:hypothetical protein